MEIRPQFIMGTTFDLFLLHYPVDKSLRVRGQVLLIPPFFEEMNKSRRFFALLAQSLVGHGFEVVMADFSGTGDSGGELEDVSWALWKQDLDSIYEWMLSNCQQPYLDIVSLRAGCLIVNEWLSERKPPVQTSIYVNPCTSGELYLKQFLRMRVISSRIAGQTETVKELKSQLDQGHDIEIAGYMLSHDLSSGMENSKLIDNYYPALLGSRILQIGMDAAAHPSPRIQKVIDKWGVNQTKSYAAIYAEQFWATQEIIAPSNVIEWICKALATDGNI